MRIPVHQIETHYEFWFWAGRLIIIDLDDLPW